MDVEKRGVSCVGDDITDTAENSEQSTKNSTRTPGLKQ